MEDQGFAEENLDQDRSSPDNLPFDLVAVGVVLVAAVLVAAKAAAALDKSRDHLTIAHPTVRH